MYAQTITKSAYFDTNNYTMFSVKPFKSIFDLLKAFPDEQSCIEHLEWIRWNGNVTSPFQEGSKVYKCPNNRYKCSATNKYFNVRTNTIFEGTKISLQHWFLAIYLFTTSNKGISSYTLAAELDITQKTAWFLLSRIRYAMEHETFIKEMEGVVEIDETFVGGKNGNRHWDKKIKGSQGRSHKDKTTVMGFYSDGKVKCEVIKEANNATIHPTVLKHVAVNSIIVTDEFKPYTYLGRNYYHQEVVDHSKGQYKNALGFTTNRIEGFWSQFKKTLIGTYHNKVSPKHLQLYANETAYRYNNRESSTNERFNVLLSSTNSRRLTYKALSHAQY